MYILISITDDAFSDTFASTLSQGSSRVLIYITTPPGSELQGLGDNHLYEMDDPYPSALHTDLKRDLHELRKRQSDGDLDVQNGLGLFEKYQFFTPGRCTYRTCQAEVVSIFADGDI